MPNMSSTNSPSKFFTDPKPRSVYKLQIYGGYLTVFARKLGRWIGPDKQHRHLWVVDGFAGAGVYEPDDDGNAQDGSPLIAAKIARKIESAHPDNYDVVQCINVEKDVECFEKLRVNLAPWKHISETLRGKFEDRVDEILAKIGDDPAFVLLDPFGLSGIEMKTVSKLLQRPGKTELLIHLSDRTFLRMAGHLKENGERQPVGHKVAESKLAALDEVMGTKLWRNIWESLPEDIEAAWERTVELYLSQLKTQVKHAHQIRVRDDLGNRAAYRLIFCAESAHGVAFMSDRACRYERELLEKDRDGAFQLFDQPNSEAKISMLRDLMLAEGRSKGPCSVNELMEWITPNHFGEYTTTDFKKVVRALIDAKEIDRATSTNVTDYEKLAFVEPPQSSLGF